MDDFPSQPLGMDSDWNIIHLSPELAEHWDKHRFGLECVGFQDIGSGMTRLTVRFNWLPIATQKQDPHRRINLENPDELPVSVFECNRATYGDVYQLTNKHGDLLSTGDTLFMDVKTDNADKSMRALILCWFVSQIASMSGAITSPEVLRNMSHEPYHDDPDTIMPFGYDFTAAEREPRMPKLPSQTRFEQEKEDKIRLWRESGEKGSKEMQQREECVQQERHKDKQNDENAKPVRPVSTQPGPAGHRFEVVGPAGVLEDVRNKPRPARADSGAAR